MTETANIVTLPAADWQMRQIKWLWGGRIPLGKITIFTGEQGACKSLASVDVAARVTRGSIFPGDTKGRTPADVLMISSDDDISDTVVPRLMAAGADLHHVEFLEGVKQKGKGVVAIRLDEHIPAIERQLRTNKNIRLVIIDPVASYFGNTRMVSGWDVRSILTPLKNMAANYGVAVLLIMNSIERCEGATAFTGMVSSSWRFQHEDDDAFSMRCVKNNLAERVAKRDLSFTVRARPVVDDIIAPYVLWGETLESKAPRTAGLSRPTPEDRVHRAIDWLAQALQGGPRCSDELIRDAKRSEGISEKMLRAAKDILNVTQEQTGIGNRKIYMWSLPEMNDRMDAVEDCKFEPRATVLDIG